MYGSKSHRSRWVGNAWATLLILGVVACDNPQPPAACGPLPQVTVNAGETTTVSACFNDPNGDILTYSATSSNPGVATASISGTSVSVRAVAPGNASVTITATDPEGLQGQQSFQVMVPNRPPQPTGTIPSVSVPVGESTTVDASSYFTEPDGQTLTYGATSSNPAVASVSVAGSTVTVTAVAKGASNVTVSATDPGGLTATQTLQSTVPNRGPEAVGAIPDQTVDLGETTTVDVSQHFSDPDGDDLTYSVASSNSSVARGSVSGSTLTVSAVTPGTATLTVTAQDEDGATATQKFDVSVPQPNRAPRRVGTIPMQRTTPGGRATVDASRYFSDPDGDPLTYTAASSSSSVARASVSGSTVTITGVATGSATITVTARDPEGLSATQTARATVGGSTGPNLVFTGISPRTVTLSPGDRFSLEYAIRNEGDAPSPRATVEVFVSSNPTISTSDRGFGTHSLRALAAGEEHRANRSITTSASNSGTAYYGYCVGPVPGESNTQDNCSPPIEVTFETSAGADLEFSGMSPRTVVVTSGTSFQLRTTLLNSGSARAAATKIRLFLSDNSTISTSDRQLGDPDDIRSLDASERADLTSTIRLTGRGSGYLGFCVDAVPGESDTTNNCSESARLTVIFYSSQTTANSTGGDDLVVEDIVFRVEPRPVPDVQERDDSEPARNAMVGTTPSFSGGKR